MFARDPEQLERIAPDHLYRSDVEDAAMAGGQPVGTDAAFAAAQAGDDGANLDVAEGLVRDRDADGAPAAVGEGQQGDRRFALGHACGLDRAFDVQA
jgi:hypothetical protein